MLTEERQKFHQKNIEYALASGDESDWHDFKIGLFKNKPNQSSSLENLRKDIVALANTIDGPYQGFGYIIIGVKDKTWQPIGIQENDQYSDLDKLRGAVAEDAQKYISPPVAVEVTYATIKNSAGEDIKLHIIAVPQSYLQWHVSTLDESSGAWVRDHHASIRPLSLQYDRYLKRIISNTTQTLQQAQQESQQEIIRLKDDIARLAAIQSPAALTANQLVKAHFHGQEQQLQRLTRDEIQIFLEKVRVLNDKIDKIGLGNDISDVQFDSIKRTEIKNCLEKCDQIIRPIIELISSIIYTVPATPITLSIMKEIYDVIIFTGNSAITLPVYTFALRNYIAQIFMQAHALATVSSESKDSWVYFKNLLTSSSKLPSVNSQRRGYLPSLLSSRQQLNQIIAVANYSHSSAYPFNQRSGKLMSAGWVGDILPVMGLEKLYSESEALITFGYYLSASYQNSGAPDINMQWWIFLEANRIMSRILNKLFDYRDLFPRESLIRAARIFDDSNKEGSLLSNTAVDILHEIDEERYALEMLERES
ncbi:helix-turn-helix domain-containing protein [Deinococcus sp. Leaf326]|uniref:AlbA family DNA-binding domain-containing protein n=1 Tax=Deinococcus sp. Leaf326 TaxID=1736338 RepID=UPI0009E78F8F|nr:ATP-binding protein [Deinococcus sp. Leaf326]